MSSAHERVVSLTGPFVAPLGWVSCASQSNMSALLGLAISMLDFLASDGMRRMALARGPLMYAC